MGRRILVLGCSGEIGSRISERFLASGHEVYGIRGSRICRIQNNNHKCLQMDLLDPGLDLDLSRIKPSILIHSAWITKPGVFWNSPQNFEWVEASKRIVSEFKSIGGEYVVVTSSCAEYSWQGNTPLSELSLTDPSSEYGLAKLAFLNWLQLNIPSYLWVRIFFQFGLQEVYGRLIPSMIDEMLAGNQYLIRSGHDVRDFVYIKDVVKVLENLVLKQINGIVNIGTGEGMTVEKVGRIIAKAIGREDLLQFKIPSQTKSIVVSDSEKLLSLFGNFNWTNFEQAIMETINSRLELSKRK
jgi:nucleoside-diphosphate-sugar epimerase